MPPVTHFPRWEPYLRLIGIPLLAVVANELVQMKGCPPGLGYFVSLCYCTFFWQGTYMIMAWTRDRFPTLATIGPRLIYLAVGASVFVALGVPLLKIVLFYTLDTQAVTMAMLGQAYLVTAVLLVMVLGLYEAAYFLRLGREASQQAGQAREEALAAQIIILKNQINPHFLFNNFNTLAGVIEEDPTLAGQMLEELARFYRHILAADEHPFYTLAQELECLSAYRFLLAMRHADSVAFHIKIPPALMANTVPPMTLQILVENAVKHNAVSVEQPLAIDIVAEGDKLRVCNTLMPRQKAMPGTGLGLANLRSRFQLLGIGHMEVLQDTKTFCVTMPLGAAHHTSPAKMIQLATAKS